MNLKLFLTRKSIKTLTHPNNAKKYIFPQPHFTKTTSTFTTFSFPPPNPTTKPLNPTTTERHFLHTLQQKTTPIQLTRIPNNVKKEQEDDNNTMNEFLSRFVYIMRSKLNESYPNCDKNTVNGMLLVIIQKVVVEMEGGGIEEMLLGGGRSDGSDVFSEDLWRVVWEVCNMVLEDMKKAEKKEKMKVFIQSEEVKEMTRFAGEVGVRGDMLRELRFKWAKEKMEESEFYESLERLRNEEKIMEAIGSGNEEVVVENVGDEKERVFELPKRHGKIKYKIYGLDLSDPKWSEVADKIHDMGEFIWPQEPKEVLGKAKVVSEKIFSLKEEDDPLSLLAEWKELLQPSRIDWINLLNQLREKNVGLYFKVAETVLGEDTFQTNIQDYSKLMDAHAKENRIEDAERILKKMGENGVMPDILTFTVMVHMYSKAGDLDHAKEAFEALKNQGFRPDKKVYNSMIMAYVNAGEAKMGELLMREMETRDIKPTKEIYMALLRSFAQHGHTSGAERIAMCMQFAGFESSLESCALLVEAGGQANNPDRARNNFDYMMKSGLRPDDQCTAAMIAAYEKKNQLNKALSLLMQLEKDGFEPGVATYSVMVDWLGKCQLVDEAEQVLEKIAALGETPPFKIHVSLCDMYSRAGVEKKALQALGVIESKKEQLNANEFERIIKGLVAGGFNQEAQRMQDLMEARGFTASEELKGGLLASQSFSKRL